MRGYLILLLGLVIVADQIEDWCQGQREEILRSNIQHQQQVIRDLQLDLRVCETRAECGCTP